MDKPSLFPALRLSDIHEVQGLSPKSQVVRLLGLSFQVHQLWPHLPSLHCLWLYPQTGTSNAQPVSVPWDSSH